MIFSFAITLILLLVYYGLIRDFRKAWNDEPLIVNGQNQTALAFTLIVPFRNEADRINDLLESIKNSDFLKKIHQIIFIDDHSEDNTAELVKAHIPNAELVRLDEAKKGKKSALYEGMLKASNEWIITTDADCALPQELPGILSSYIAEKDPVLISLPLKMNVEGNGFFSFFQALEFMSLNGSGGAALMKGFPLMCNGAGLCFRKSLFHEAFPSMHPEFPGGDDMFLLEYASGKYPGKSFFVKSVKAMVQTRAERGWRTFLAQRIKWTAKSPLYRNADLVRVSMLIWIVNVWFIASLFLIPFDLKNIMVPVFWMLIKTFIDWKFLKDLQDFYKISGFGKMNVFLSQLIYPFYIFMASLGGFASYLTIRMHGKV